MATGLRERKKREARLRITEAARMLFLERGFDAVTVAEVAKRADVSEATVFNYFATKEDIFVAGLEAFEQRLIDAVQRRPHGESAIVAFRRAMLESVGRLDDVDVVEVVRRSAQVIADSRALQRRELEIVAEHARALATALTRESGIAEEDPGTRVAAEALFAVHRAVLDRVRAAALEGRTGAEVAEAATSAAEHGFAMLERGLEYFAVR